MVSLKHILEENGGRVKRMYNYTNSCFLISLFNVLCSSDVFTAALNELKAVPGAAGLLEELR